MISLRIRSSILTIRRTTEKKKIIIFACERNFKTQRYDNRLRSLLRNSHYRGVLSLVTKLYSSQHSVDRAKSQQWLSPCAPSIRIEKVWAPCLFLISSALCICHNSVFLFFSFFLLVILHHPYYQYVKVQMFTHTIILSRSVVHARAALIHTSFSF